MALQLDHGNEIVRPRALNRSLFLLSPCSLLIALLLVGCGGGGSGQLVVNPPPTAPPPTTPPPTPPPPPDYTTTGNVLVDTSGIEELRNVRTTGSLTKAGSGQLNLIEYNRFDAGTFVNAGSVHAMGDLRSNVTIAQGAELVSYGYKIIGNVINGGKFSNANCNGSFGCYPTTIEGTYVQTADATLRVQLGTGTTGLSLTDSVTLAGTLEFFVDPNGYYDGVAPYRESILASDWLVSGRFDRVTSPGLFFEGTLVYFPSSVVLDVTRVPVAVVMQAQGVGDPVLLSTAGRIDGAFNAADPQARQPRAEMPLAQRQFFTSATALQHIRGLDQAIASLDSLSGQSHLVVNGWLLDSPGLSGQLQARLDGLRFGSAAGTWSGLSEDGGDLSGAFTTGGRYSVSGLVAGHDRWLSPRWLLAGGTGRSVGQLQFDRGGGRAQIESTPFEVAAMRDLGTAYAALGASYRRSRITVERPLDVADGRTHMAHSEREAATMQVRAEIGRWLPTQRGRLQPFAALSHERIRTDAFTEHGDTGFELAVQGMDLSRTSIDVGARYLRQWESPSGQWRQLDVSGHRRSVLGSDGGMLQAAFTGMPLATFAMEDPALRHDQTVWSLRWAGRAGRHWWWYGHYRLAGGGPLPIRSAEVGVVLPF